MRHVENVSGFIIRPLGDFSEDFKIRGLLLPKNEVSRNNVLYDWDSVRSKAKEFEGVTMNYNHLTDDDKPPIGKIKETIILEQRPADGKWQVAWDKVKEQNGKEMPGVYYEADVDEDSEYANSIKKGYLNKVSIQVMASAQKTEKNADGEGYTRAFIGSPLEVSVVKVPGFNQTTMEVALAEAFKRESKEEPGVPKKDGTGPNPDCPLKKEEDEEEDKKEESFFSQLNDIKENFNNEVINMEAKEFVEKYEKDLDENKESFEKVTSILEGYNKRLDNLEAVEEEDEKEKEAVDDDETVAKEATDDEKKPDSIKEESEEDEDTKKESEEDEDTKKESEEDEDTKKESEDETDETKKEEVDDEDKKEELDDKDKKEELDDKDKKVEATAEDDKVPIKKEGDDAEDDTKKKEEDDEDEKGEEEPKAPKVEKLKLKDINVLSTFKRQESFLTK